MSHYARAAAHKRDAIKGNTIKGNTVLKSAFDDSSAPVVELPSRWP